MAALGDFSLSARQTRTCIKLGHFYSCICLESIGFTSLQSKFNWIPKRYVQELGGVYIYETSCPCLPMLPIHRILPPSYPWSVFRFPVSLWLFSARAKFSLEVLWVHVLCLISSKTNLEDFSLGRLSCGLVTGTDKTIKVFLPNHLQDPQDRFPLRGALFTDRRRAPISSPDLMSLIDPHARGDGLEHQCGSGDVPMPYNFNPIVCHIMTR